MWVSHAKTMSLLASPTRTFFRAHLLLLHLVYLRKQKQGGPMLERSSAHRFDYKGRRHRCRLDVDAASGQLPATADDAQKHHHQCNAQTNSIERCLSIVSILGFLVVIVVLGTHHYLL